MGKFYFKLVSLLALAVLFASIGVAVTWSPAQATVVIKPIIRHRLLIRAVTLLRSKPAAVSYSYTVRPGDTLSSIAETQYGDVNDWPSLWWINKRAVRNPNLIQVGQRLKLSNWHPNSGWILSYAVKAADPQPIYHTSPMYSADNDSNQQHSAPSYNTQQVTLAGASYSSPSNYSGFQQCVVSRESGGNAQVMNSTSHYGLYQFSYSTWIAAGGNPADFGHASVGEQNRTFANAYRMWGTSPWAPYDGC